MKTYLLTASFLTITMLCYSQVEVDSIIKISESSDSIGFMTYTTIQSCYSIDSFGYTYINDSIIVNYYMTEVIPYCDCADCQHQLRFKIKKEGYVSVIFNTYIRDFNATTFSFTEYYLYSIGTVDLSPNNTTPRSEIFKPNIFPNPSKDFIFTEVEGEMSEVIIYNAKGLLVIRKELTHPQSIDISLLPAGTYFLTLDNKNFFPLIKK